MDAEIRCTYRPVSDVHSKGTRAFRWQGRWATNGIAFDIMAGHGFKFMDLVCTCWNSLGIEVVSVCSGGMYGNFAGRDASWGMAKQSFDSGMFYYGFFWVRCITQLPSLGNADPDRPSSGQAGGLPPR